MPKYNGYRSWNEWNVALWINNDEALYAQAHHLARIHGIGKAAYMLLWELEGQQTPDGANYNISGIRAALRGIL